MIIDLFDLNINGKKINIDGEVNIPLELLNDSSIRRLDNVYFQGYINKLIDDSYELCGTLSGDMILPDDITLEDYKYNFTSEIEEKIDETRINLQKVLILLWICGKIFLWKFLLELLTLRMRIFLLVVMAGDLLMRKRLKQRIIRLWIY